ncbi:MAG: hypothetical protein SFU85_02175 [Candidatus Methylacidiphilales bacterium]|nr:hypothetical protein [Candidatus Methylacidiphilales bacterium]
MDKNYSPFTPLVIVLAALVLFSSFDLFVTLRQRSALGAQWSQMVKVLPEAQRINQTMISISRDLIALAPRSPGAKRLVEDFKIQAVRPSAPDKKEK